MNPHQKNKIDINSLSSDEQRLFRLYGKLPNKKDLLQNKLKERKYFDSGDYAMSKAGKAPDHGVTSIGTEHPKADDIPHMSPLTNTVSRGDSISQSPGSMSNPNALATSPDGLPILPPAGIHRGSINGVPGGQQGSLLSGASRSPIKESSYLARTASAEDGSGNEGAMQAQGETEMSVSPPLRKEGIPIRR